VWWLAVADVDRSDLDACGDVFDWLAEHADELPPEKAIEMLEAAQNLQNKLKLAVDLLRSRALSTIEQPILIGRVAYSKKPQIKQRPDQTKIAGKVVRLAVCDAETGEKLDDTETVAERAVALMQSLYVSPSTVPKVGGIRNLGMTMQEVTREEHTGWELKRTELE
jgi:hypothetical protein